MFLAVLQGLRLGVITPCSDLTSNASTRIWLLLSASPAGVAVQLAQRGRCSLTHGGRGYLMRRQVHQGHPALPGGVARR
jgi:hypothetical protein